MKTISSSQNLFLRVLSLLSALIWLSCRGNGLGLTEMGSPIGAAGFAAQIQPIFDSNCVRCHAPGGLGFTQTGGAGKNGLDLTFGNSYERLFNQATYQHPESSPKWRVLPGDPDASYIIQKIVSRSPKFGKRMPYDGPPFLSSGEVELLRDWIARGAPND